MKKYIVFYQSIRLTLSIIPVYDQRTEGNIMAQSNTRRILASGSKRNCLENHFLQITEKSVWVAVVRGTETCSGTLTFSFYSELKLLFSVAISARKPLPNTDG